MRAMDLTPGDVFVPDTGHKVFTKKDGITFIGHITPHPFYPHLWMVIWRMPNGNVSMDALNPLQEIQGVWVRNSREDLKRAIGIQ